MRIRLTLAYDGTDFEGWQVQAGAVRRGGVPPRTVQGVLEDALARLAGGQRVRIVGAGRTDAGVHALGQVASFELPREMAPGALVRALNGLLPADVRALGAATAPADFDARRSATSKLYRYVLDCGPVQLPTARRYAGHLPTGLDQARVQEAAALYLGRHDFASLASSGGSVKTTVRTVTRSDVRFDQATLTYEVEADGFLRKMVRSLVGGLIAVGRGVRSPDDLRAALDARDRRRWPAPAEARGLTLVRVEYDAAKRVLR
ncbi:MAG TPA: tRNA pseudouridine(38-40) synthase TruA [Vicinamibacteria bacterium]|nr:tRNA pseudouridine(38-40) synthase TruA [Vicinamibacteria bacterium]